MSTIKYKFIDSQGLEQAVQNVKRDSDVYGDSFSK